MKEEKIVEVARSFSLKLNLGNYSNADFFCSQKCEAEESEAEKVSGALYEFCRREVIKSVNAYKAELDKEKNKPNRQHEAKGLAFEARDNFPDEVASGEAELKSYGL